jgi:hypothetical protein
MKNILAENMLRFGVKNLSEKSKKKLAEQNNPAVNISALKPDYDEAMKSVWYEIRNNIVHGGSAGGKNTGVMTWQYPAVDKENPIQLHKPDGSIVDQATLDAYDTLFNQKLDAASNDNTWLTKVAKLAFAKNTDKTKNKNFQTYLMSLIKDEHKSLVKDNGSGGPFNDGVFYAVTMKAAIKYRLDQGYKDSAYMIKNRLI